MNLQVPPKLEAKLTRLAAETGRTADQVALDLLASSMDHDEWFRAEVEKAAPPPVRAGCSSTMTSLLAWIGAIAGDARPLDDGRHRRSRGDLRLCCPRATGGSVADCAGCVASH
jgi:hypothetical protein